VLVATPIGNLSDLSERARDTLAAGDVIYCEDTRRTRALLSHCGITGKPLVRLDANVEARRAKELIGRVRGGQLVVLVSDAGMPGISDPGERLVSAAARDGITVDVVPGPNAALSALVLSGLPADRFCFEGFLPRRGAERRRRLAAIGAEARTTVVYEAPSRLAATLADLSAGCEAHREVCIARELTKLHQEVWRGTLADATAWAAGRDLKGEVVLVIAGSPPAKAPDAGLVRFAVAESLASGMGVREAASEVAASLGVSRHYAYEIALGLRRESS
jgi:16S rRNA (cytidine1402-2'-O)-methyltransferase